MRSTRLCLWLIGVCFLLGASFPVRQGMTIAEGAADCGVSQAAFVDANSPIIRHGDGGAYVLYGFYFVCPPTVHVWKVSQQWDVRRPLDPPVPTVAQLERLVASGAVFATVNEADREEVLYLSNVAGQHFGHIGPNNDVYWWGVRGGASSIRIGLWQHNRPEPKGMCNCRVR